MEGIKRKTCTPNAKEHIGKLKCYRESVLWTDEVAEFTLHLTIYTAEKGHSLATSKHHPGGKFRWREHHDLLWLCC